MSGNPSSWACSGTLAGVFAFSLSMFPVMGHAAGGDAQAAVRPATLPAARPVDLAGRNPAVRETPVPGVPVQPAARPELDCLIEPYMSVELATSVSGIVKIVNVDRGDIIRTGQVLAQLEAEVEKANVAREQARAEFASKKYHRMRELYKEQMVSAQQMEEAKADSELAAAELRKAVEMLNQRTVYAPFNGVVVDRFVSPGELVESKKVLKVAQINPLSVEVIAPISMLGEFRHGGKVRVSPEGPMAGPFEAQVRLVDRVVDAPSGSFRVRLALPNPKHQIAAGVRCKAQLLPPAPVAAVAKAKAKAPVRSAGKPKAPVPAAVPPATDVQRAPATNATPTAATAGTASPKAEPEQAEARKSDQVKSEVPAVEPASTVVPSNEAVKVETPTADTPKPEASGAAAPGSEPTSADSPRSGNPATDSAASAAAPDVAKDIAASPATPSSEVTKHETAAVAVTPKADTPPADVQMPDAVTDEAASRTAQATEAVATVGSSTKP